MRINYTFYSENNSKEKLNSFLPTNDYVFKRIFGYTGNESITKSLLSSILGQEIKEINLDENTFLEKDILDDKLGILDIKATININIICDIEMQVVNQKDIEKRILFYWSKLYNSNIKAGKNYNVLKRTIVIMFMNDTIESLKEIPKYHTQWNIREKEYRSTILTDVMELHILELPKLLKINTGNNIKERKLAVWCKFILNPNKLEEKELSENEEVKKAKEEYDKIKKDKKEQWLADLRLIHMMDTKAVEEYGYDKGVEKGLEQGKKEKIEIAKKLLKTGMTIQEVMEITNLTKEEIEKS